jgi:hypothetical protein
MLSTYPRHHVEVKNQASPPPAQARRPAQNRRAPEKRSEESRHREARKSPRNDPNQQTRAEEEARQRAPESRDACEARSSEPETRRAVWRLRAYTVSRRGRLQFHEESGRGPWMRQRHSYELRCRRGGAGKVPGVRGDEAHTHTAGATGTAAPRHRRDARAPTTRRETTTQ